MQAISWNNDKYLCICSKIFSNWMFTRFNHLTYCFQYGNYINYDSLRISVIEIVIHTKHASIIIKYLHFSFLVLMPHFSFKSWRAVCLTKILAPFIAGYYSWITHSTIDFNRSILDVYLFLHDKNRTHYISMIVSKIKKNWVRQKSNNYMYFKVYGIFISLLSLYFTKKIHWFTQLGQEYFIFIYLL